ncbi:MAG: DUF2769 domain-containing protein, partial [Methanobacterium sp.]
PGCPVQAKSGCVQEKMNKLKSQRSGVPSIDDFPGVYCGTGKARCEGLDLNPPCQCPKCEVWKEYNLEDEEIHLYFCTEGKTK